MIFKEEGEKLVLVCSKVLGITIEDLRKMIEQNNTANKFLKDELILQHTGRFINLKILVSSLLSREFGNLSKVNEEEVNIIKEFYNINLKIEDINKNSYLDNEIFDFLYEDLKSEKNTNEETLFREEGEVLISVCSHALGIDIKDLKNIIKRNETAMKFLMNESELKSKDDLDNMKILVGNILSREFGDLAVINDQDVNFIREKYGIEIIK